MNFGHTYGHAYESYHELGKYLHGECVAMGMMTVIKNKEIIYFDDQTGTRKGNTTPDVYWSDYQKGLFENELNTVFKEFNKEV